MQNNDYASVVEQIKDKLDRVDVVSESVILKKSGNNYWGLCPFHNEKTPSFSVNPQNKYTNVLVVAKVEMSFLLL